MHAPAAHGFKEKQRQVLLTCTAGGIGGRLVPGEVDDGCGGFQEPGCSLLLFSTSVLALCTCRYSWRMAHRTVCSGSRGRPDPRSAFLRHSPFNAIRTCLRCSTGMTIMTRDGDAVSRKHNLPQLHVVTRSSHRHICTGRLPQHFSSPPRNWVLQRPWGKQQHTVVADGRYLPQC